MYLALITPLHTPQFEDIHFSLRKIKCGSLHLIIRGRSAVLPLVAAGAVTEVVTLEVELGLGIAVLVVRNKIIGDLLRSKETELDQYLNGTRFHF
jgi:hypothetical protein